MDWGWMSPNLREQKYQPEDKAVKRQVRVPLRLFPSKPAKYSLQLKTSVAESKLNWNNYGVQM